MSGYKNGYHGGNDMSACRHSINNRSICRKCGKFHDRVRRQRTTKSDYITPHAGDQRRLNPVYKGRSRAREREERDLERALVDIAVQESLEAHNGVNDLVERKTDYVDYEKYGNPSFNTSRSRQVDQDTRIVNNHKMKYSDIVSDSSSNSMRRRFDMSGAESSAKSSPEPMVKITTRRFEEPGVGTDLSEEKETLDSFDRQTRDGNSKTNNDISDNDTDLNILSINNGNIEEESRSCLSRLSIIVGRGRKPIDGNKNYPLNPALGFDSYVMFIDQLESPDPDIITKIEDLKLEELGISPEVNDIRVYFDWSTFYCTAMQNIVKFMTRTKKVIDIPLQVYAPLYADDQSIPGDVKRNVMESPSNKGDTHLMMVYGSYPLFDWQDRYSLEDLKQNVNPEKYIMITNHDI